MGKFFWPDKDNKENGKVYEGMWQRGKQHGVGIVTYSNGEVRKS